MVKGISLAGAIFIVFLILKLAEVGTVATWSWWWVTCPLWGGLALALAILIIIVLLSLIFGRR